MCFLVAMQKVEIPKMEKAIPRNVGQKICKTFVSIHIPVKIMISTKLPKKYMQNADPKAKPRLAINKKFPRKLSKYMFVGYVQGVCTIMQGVYFWQMTGSYQAELSFSRAVTVKLKHLRITFASFSLELSENLKKSVFSLA